MNKEDFKTAVSELDTIELIQSKIIFGECAVIGNAQHYYLRRSIADQFEVHPNEVIVVGSAKLGFSIAPHKTLRDFSDESDVDVAI